MKFTPSSIRQVLDDLIHEMADYAWLFARNPKTDFSRKSKLGFEKTISILLSLGGKSIANELLDFFHCDGNGPSPSAFVQSRDKLLPEALEFLFHEFIRTCTPEKNYHGYRLLAVDGSEVQIPTNPNHADFFFPGRNDQKPYNLLLLTAMYDLMNHTYLDAVVEGARAGSEQRDLTTMVDRSHIESAILVADRGFESYNCLAHLQEKGWKFLFRVKNSYGGIAHGLDLPDTDEFNLWFDMHLTRKQTNEMKNLFPLSLTIFHFGSSASNLPTIPMKPSSQTLMLTSFPLLS